MSTLYDGFLYRCSTVFGPLGSALSDDWFALISHPVFPMVPLTKAINLCGLDASAELAITALSRLTQLGGAAHRKSL
jgi:hypothetical protein